MLLLAAVVFIGSQVCKPCHSGIFEAYARTPMAQSSGRVETMAAANFTAAGHRYRIADNKLFFEGGSATIDYFVGSNAAGRTYLRERDGYVLTQARRPLSIGLAALLVVGPSVAAGEPL